MGYGVTADLATSLSKMRASIGVANDAKYYTPQQLAKELLNNPKFRFSETDQEREKAANT